jgi:tetratricopeptide (TPR) repeat protein
MREVVLESYARNNTNVILALEALYLSCDVDSKSEFHARLKETEAVLSIGSSAALGVDSVSKMADAKEHGECPHLSYEHMQKLVDLLLNNKQAQANSNVMATLHALKYRLYVAQASPARAYQEILTAFSFKKGLAIALTAGRFAASEGRHDEAIAFLERALLHAPANPILQREWQQLVGALLGTIKEQRAIILQGRAIQ